jgi:hypothetical protein
MDLGPKTLRLCTVPDDCTINKNMEYMVSPETRALVAGSPMARDDNGILRIIKSEEPVPLDMRFYLDAVDVKPGEPVAYITFT